MQYQGFIIAALGSVLFIYGLYFQYTHLDQIDECRQEEFRKGYNQGVKYIEAETIRAILETVERAKRAEIAERLREVKK